MRQVSLVVAAAVVGLVACRTESTLQPNQPTLNALIVDGAHAGNPNFFFLPPLVPSPVGSANYDAGKFNAHLSPFVEVCELAANPILVPNTDCKTSTPLVFGPAKMSLDATSEQYQLNWDTKSSGLSLTSFYRISVRGSARGTVLGLVDVDPITGGVKNLKTGDVVQFQDGRTLPIKVRIEQGAFGSTNSSDNVEQVVPAVLPPTGLDVTTNTGFAGAHFPNGWLPEGIDQVVVIIERLPVNDGGSESSCLQSGLEELEGCYRFRTDPDLHGLGSDGQDLLFALPVIAGVCFQFPGDIGHENEHPFQLHRREEVRGVPVGSAQPLDEVPAPFLHCDGFGATPPSIGAAFRSGRVRDIARAGLYAVTHAIGRAIEPKALHAVDFGAGGSTDGFSRFGYARRAFMTVTAGDGATATEGSTIDAAVKVQNVHHEVTSAVVGQSVTFTVTGGGGTVSTPTCAEGTSCSATTSSDGVAGVTWRLGVGVNTIQVTTAHVTNSPRTITATGTAAGVWTSAGSLPNAGTRRDHTATLLNNGDVLIVGGTSPGAVIYNPSAGSFIATEGTPLFNHNQGASATKLLDGRVLIVGGNGSPFRAEIYDPGTGSFSATAGGVGLMNASRAAHTATLLPDGRVLLAGGQTEPDAQSHNEAEIYDPETDTFTPTGSLNVDRYGHAAILLPNGQVLVVGGNRTTSPGVSTSLASAELYDPATGTFSSTGSMAEGRGSLGFTDITLLGNGKVLVVGGLSGLTTAELYDPSTGTFSATGSMGGAHDAGRATLLSDGRVLVAGGFVTGGCPITLSGAEIYDPVQGTFTGAAPMTTSRLQFTATRLNDGHVLAVGGFSNVSATACGDLGSAELFSLPAAIP